MKLSRYFIATLVLSCLLAMNLNAQYYLSNTQFTRNEILYNPAYAANDDYFNLTANVRQQWTGFEGAPSTQTVHLYGPVEPYNWSFGATVLADKIGVTNQQVTNLVYAYQIKTRKYMLSFGMNAGFRAVRNFFHDLTLEQLDDPNFVGSRERQFMPHFGVGSYFVTRYLTLGVSVPIFLNTTFGGKSSYMPMEKAFFTYIHGSYLIKYRNSMSLKSTALVKGGYKSDWELDIFETIYLNRELAIELAYKSFSAIGIGVSYVFMEQCAVAYSYDFSTSKLFTAQYGSHEISLSWMFNQNKKTRRYINPRYW